MKLKAKIEQYLGLNTPQNKKDFLVISVACIGAGILLSFLLSFTMNWHNKNTLSNKKESGQQKIDKVEPKNNHAKEVSVNTSFLAIKTAENLLQSKKLSEYEVLNAMTTKGFSKSESMAAINLFDVNFSDRALSMAISILETNKNYVNQDELKRFLIEKYLFSSKDVDLAISKIDYVAYSEGKKQ
jgi:hypothetical protein